ncbi:MAG: hypothetical protein Q9224_004921, partial [Gallowayella concinna]
MRTSTLIATAITLALSMQSTAAVPAAVPAAKDKAQNWKVEIFTDDLCQDSTGIYSHNQPTKESFDGLPPIMSLRASGWLTHGCGKCGRCYVDVTSGGKQQFVLSNVCTR